MLVCLGQQKPIPPEVPQLQEPQGIQEPQEPEPQEPLKSQEAQDPQVSNKVGGAVWSNWTVSNFVRGDWPHPNWNDSS